METWEYQRNKWIAYEIEKKRLQRRDLSPSTYEIELAKVIERLKI